MSINDNRATEYSRTAGEAGDGLAGKTAVILGTSTPCGKATARMLAERGVNLVLGGRSRDKLETLQREIEASGGQALTVGTDVSQRHHLERTVEATVEHFGRLDILVYGARTGSSPLSELDPESWEWSVDVNLKGFLYGVGAVLPAMLEVGGGEIVALGAEIASDPLCRATRAALEVVVEEMNHEFSGGGVYTKLVEKSEPARCAKAVLDNLHTPGR